MFEFEEYEPKNKNGYCSVCGTPLETERKWEENYSGYGPAGHYYESYYCPRCREEELRRAKAERKATEEKERRQREKEEKERQSQKMKRLEKYKKYMPKKVTAIVLTYEEAKHLRNLLQEDIKNFKEDIENDNLYIDEVLLEKVIKAKEETDYTFKESEDYAKNKGWEKEE